MKIDSASSSPSLAQRQLMTRTPDQDFQRDFQAAYARLAVAAEGSAEQAGALADTLGATQLEYSRVRGVSLEDQLRFAHVLNRACENGAQLDARGFLARLGADDLQALRRNMGLAEPIRVEALSEEGARNLLLPEGYSVDLDGDGITEVGAAKIRHFPPRDAPQAFLDQWLALTAGMDGAAYSNARDGLQWAFDIRAMAGQPLATDQLASYRTAVDDYLGMLAEHRHALVPGQYERDLPLYQALRQRLA